MAAAALAYLVASQGDAVGLAAYDEAVRQYVPARTGQSHLRQLLTTLSKVAPTGATSAARALRRSVDLLKRRGLLILISDLYDDEAALEAGLRRAVRMGHEVAIIHVLTRDEIAFPFGQEVELEDLESGRRLVTGAGAAASYRHAFAEFLERWHARAARERIDYIRVVTDQPLDSSLRGYLLRRGGGAG
jgi:uncharacterized protein (DUF58 family)